MRIYNKAYEFRLLPTLEQIILIIKTFGCVRFIWNKMLNYKISHYEKYGEMGYITPAVLKKEFEWLREVDSLALANVQLQLNKAFDAFFKKITQFPRFKSKKHLRKSYTTNNQPATQAIRIQDGKIRLPKLGFVQFIQHILLKECEKIKACTIKMTASGKFYVSILVEGVHEIKMTKPRPEKVLGLDFSMPMLFVSSAGEKANHARYFRSDEAKLHALSRSVSRKKKGGKNYQKARIKKAKWHEHVANKRKDFQHKLSYHFAEFYDAIVVEDLNMHGMSQALNFGKSVADNAFGMFRRLLEYKLVDRGKQFIVIDKWFASSKMCSNCGIIKNELRLSERIYLCDACGYKQDRDINAAINIRTAEWRR